MIDRWSSAYAVYTRFRHDRSLSCLTLWDSSTIPNVIAHNVVIVPLKGVEVTDVD